MGRIDQYPNFGQGSGMWTPGPTFPTNPADGDIFFETDTDTLWNWNGASWDRVWSKLVPTCGLLRGTNQSIPTGTFDEANNAIAWSAQNWDIGDMWTSGDPRRIYCKRNGLYLITASAFWAASAASNKDIYIIKNNTGSNRHNFSVVNTASEVGLNASGQMPMLIGDYFGIWAHHNAGAGVNLLAGQNGPFVHATWIAEYPA